MVGLRHTGTAKCDVGPFTNKQPSSLNGHPMKQQYIVSEGHANVPLCYSRSCRKSQDDHERVLSVAVSNGTGKVIFYKQHQQRSNPFPMM